jgi:hypothetical protein
MMSPHVRARPAWTLTALAALGLVACAHKSDPATDTGAKTMAQQSSPSTASDLVEAIVIAERNFGQANASVGDYRLVHAQRLLAGGEHCSRAPAAGG